jgi:uncharacterized membrane protein
MAVAKRLKSYFFRGLAVLLPTILTILLITWGYRFIQRNIGVHINRFLVWLAIQIWGPENQELWHKFWLEGWGSAAGFVVALILVLAVGVMVANVVGKTLWRIVEKFVMNAPVLNQVYPYIKQVTDFLLSQEKAEKLFSRVVLVEFPRKGCWAVGMVTGSGIKTLSDNMGKKFLTVFVASTPSPLTGFAVMVPEDETIDIGMTVEEALRFIISGGVIAPQSSIDTGVSLLADENLRSNSKCKV